MTKEKRISINMDQVTGKVFFTADTHFGSQRTLDLSRRPFESVEEMDAFMIEKWNNVVKHGDTVFHLGDFGDFNVRKKLNGRIILIQGNYEEEIPDEDVTKYLEDYDIYVTGSEGVHASIEITHNDCKYILTHRPIDCVREDIVNFTEHFSLFGHIHGRQFIKKFGIDVGVDCNHFKPISWEDVEFFQNAINKGYYDENVWC